MKRTTAVTVQIVPAIEATYREVDLQPPDPLSENGIWEVTAITTAEQGEVLVVQWHWRSMYAELEQLALLEDATRELMAAVEEAIKIEDHPDVWVWDKIRRYAAALRRAKTYDD